MQFIFFVPPNEELEGTLHPQKFGCTPKKEGKRVHVPPDEKTCGHTHCRQSSDRKCLGYFKAVFFKQTRIIIASIYKYTVYIMF